MVVGAADSTLRYHAVLPVPGSNQVWRVHYQAHFAPFKDNESTYFMLLNRGKKSIAIDLKAEDGVAMVRELAKASDVVVENFRPGVQMRVMTVSTPVRQPSRLVYAHS